MTWKGFATPSDVNDKNKSKKDVIVEVGVKATDTASDGDHEVFGVTGAWFDDGDGIPEAATASSASVSGQVSVNVAA